MINHSSICINPEGAFRQLKNSIQLTVGGNGPVFLSIPINIINAQINGLPTDKLRDIETIKTSYSSCPNDGLLNRAVDKIVNTKKILVIGGYGVLASRATNELSQLINKLNAPVVTTSKAKSCFPNSNPLFFGTIGYAGSEMANNLLNNEKFDVIVVVGSKLGSWSTNLWCKNLTNSYIIQIDNNINSLNKNLQASICLLGDARMVLRKLISKISSRSLNNTQQYILELKDKYSKREERLPTDNKNGEIKPYLLFKKIRSVFDKNVTFIVDAGTCRAWAINVMEFDLPNTFIEGGGFSPMGYATAGAIGAKLAVGNKPIVAIVGDGSFLMHGSEIHTAVEYGLPIIWFIVNNQGLAAIHHGQIQTGFSSTANFYKNRPQFDLMAKSMGANGYRIKNVNQLNCKFIDKILKDRRPTVIDIIANRDKPPPVKF